MHLSHCHLASLWNRRICCIVDASFPRNALANQRSTGTISYVLGVPLVSLQYIVTAMSIYLFSATDTVLTTLPHVDEMKR
jgi:hypothetical protein